ncbi:AI-2E family transporter [Synechocystis sp. LKSZ1]|uniref:AI-2E family transporter n=1 Tax=Synechocystis sp. LKSZ1 TaxID=3144951 RepID=UPI00336C1D3C
MDSNVKNVDFLIRLGILGGLGAWCFLLLRPFMDIILWSTILAIAIFPIFEWLRAVLQGRSKLASALLILLGLGIIIGPVSVMATLSAGNAQALADQLKEGALVIPPPSSDISSWPLIGPPIYGFWAKASSNLGSVLSQFKPQLKDIATKILLLAADTSLILLKFMVSIVIANILILNQASLKISLTRLMTRLSPERGPAFLKLMAVTIRSVTRGILGVAVIQTLLVGLGFMVAKIPAAGLLIPLCLLLTIVQIGPGIIIIGTLVYAWFTFPPLAALAYTLWMIPCMLVDNVLKPILMARGLPVPMVVILIGVLGGTLTQGILGLFIGPVVLSLGYELLRAWISETALPPTTALEETAP